MELAGMETYTHQNFPMIELIRIRCLPLLPFLHRLFVSFVFFLCSTGILFLLPSNPALANSFAVSNASPSEKYLEEGLGSFQRGDFKQAILNWMEAARIYERAGKIDEQSA